MKTLGLDNVVDHQIPQIVSLEPKPAPAVPLRSLLKMLSQLKKDPIAAQERLLKDFGNVVRLSSPRGEVHLFFHPDHIKYFLKDNASNYIKAPSGSYELEAFMGKGLLTSEGQLWKQQRKLIAPEFQLHHLKAFVSTMVKAAEDLGEEWEKSAEPRNIAADMMRLTFRIAGETMFGTNVDKYAAAVSKSLVEISEIVVRRIESPIRIPRWVPTPLNLKARAQTKKVAVMIKEIIHGRIANPDKTKADLLSRLLAARDPLTGVGMSDEQLYAEVVTLLAAGHETTANSMAWTWYLLSQNKDVYAELQEELDRVLNGRAPTYDDLVNLPLTRMIFQESMRLYPPAPLITRSNIEKDTIGGYTIPKNSTLFVPIMVTQRRSDMWSEPERFNPKRFLPENMKKMHPFQFIPFGGGPRECIGKNFAMIEGQILIATLAQRFSIELVESHPVVPQVLITLRPKYGIVMRLKPRNTLAGLRPLGSVSDR